MFTYSILAPFDLIFSIFVVLFSATYHYGRHMEVNNNYILKIPSFFLRYSLNKNKLFVKLGKI